MASKFAFAARDLKRGLALAKLDISVEVVRHPSYGGQAEFIAGVNHIYGVAKADTAQHTLDLQQAGARSTRAYAA